MSAGNRLSKGFRLTFLGRIVHISANAALMVLLTRYLLQPAEYGLLFLGLSVVGVARLFSDLGLAKSAARYVSEFKENDPAQIPHVLLAALKYRLALVALVGGVLAVANQPIARFIGEPELAPLLLVGAGYLGVHSLSVFNSLLFQGFNRVEWSALVQIVNNANRVVFVVVFVFGLGLGAVGAMLGYLAGAGLAMLVGTAILYRKFYSRHEKADSPEEGLSRRVLEYSVPLTVTKGAGVLNNKIDTILIGVLLNPAAVGFYTIAKQISSSVLAPAGSLGFTISPELGEQKANEQLDRAAELYQQAVEYTLLLYIPGAVGLVLVAEPTVRVVFGEEYLSAVPVVQVFGAYVVLRAINKITTKTLDFLGRARIRAIAKGVTAGANFVLNLLLIPRFGVVGAGFATVATYGAYTAINVSVMQSELPLALSDLGRSVALIGGTAIGMAAVVFASTPLISNAISLAGVVLLGVAVWAGLSIASGLVNPRTVVSFLASD
ncbi:flippase [Halorussus lipolyticus]|uniref:flippase n=1 Tax=Halorussus lipolyticus TaxID=3034024 RepID=UPI0023E83D35|nr:flippase [Halorussus sp. DT80]